MPLRLKIDGQRKEHRILSPGFGPGSVLVEQRSQQVTSTQPVFDDDSDDLEFMDADKLILTDADVSVDHEHFTPKRSTLHHDLPSFAHTKS